MSRLRLTQQLSDLFTYLLIPGLAIIVPARFSRWMVRKASAWRWFMAAPAEAAWQGAKKFVDVSDEGEFKKRYKQVELLDVRDLYMILCGRDQAVMAEVQMDVPVELVKDRVIIGMHWGPSISILRILQLAGMQPAFPYRPPQKEVLRIRPFYYLFSTLAAHYLVKTMGERAVPVGGAGKILRGFMYQPGSTLVLMDAPPMEGRPVLKSDVLGKPASFNAAFPITLADTEKEYVFYAISLQPGDALTKRLELNGPHSSSDAQEFLQRYAGFLEQHISDDPAQWRFWNVTIQFWHQDQFDTLH